MNRDKLIQSFENQLIGTPNAANVLLYNAELPQELTKQIVDLIVKLRTVPAITSQENCADVNKILAEAKRLVKRIQEAGLELRRPVQDISKEILEYEKKVLGELTPLVDLINGKITEFQRAEDKKAKDAAEKIRLENEAKMKLEQERVSTIKKRIASVQKNILDKLSSTTNIKELEDGLKTVKGLKFTSEQYQEFLPEMVGVHTDLVSKFETKIDQLKELEANKVETGEDPDAAIKQLQANEALEVQRANNIAAENIEAAKTNIAANSQMATELQTSQLKGAQSVQRKYKLTAVDNLALVPREYLCLDEKKVNEAIKRGIYVIPGLKIDEELNNVSR